MFLGHFGVGLAAKKAVPQVSLGILFLAAQFLDLLWPTLLLLDLEQVSISPGITTVTPLDFTHYPISHSLLAVCGWGVLLGGLYWLLKKDSRAAIIITICVISHWVLDFVMHRPDLPIYPGGSTRAGLGLWNSLVVTIILESVIFFGGVVLYLKSTKAKNRIGIYGFWVMILLLTIIFIANVFGPPPPDVKTIAWAGHLQWLFVLFGWWVDKNRISVAGNRVSAISNPLTHP